MTQVYLSLGSNLDREKNIRAGLDALVEQFGELTTSRVYESESVGFKGSRFFNMVVGIKTDKTIAALSESLKKIEDDNGRIRSGPKYSPRTLDIDILTYDDFVGLEAGVELPRGEITENAFVLLPLSELAPEAVHPVCQKSYADLWQAYDKNAQPLWPIFFEWCGCVISAGS
jgi:2-amino-4-hydroxy-6-hydroxymethyldihydropteridine diphosphokinase